MIYGYDSGPSTSGALPYPPQEMPGTEQGLTEGFCGIQADEMKVTVDLQEILLHPALTGKMVILRKELPEITPAQDFTQEQLPPLPVHRYQHPVIPQAEYYGRS
jgi:hypothetical protein